MNRVLHWSVAVCAVLCNYAVVCTAIQSSSADATLSIKEMPSEITHEATCGEWASWIPPRSFPSVVMQVVSKPYADVERNFIRLMEMNSNFTRQHLYLMCMDGGSVPMFASLGIRCVPLGTLHLHSHKDIWETRVRVLKCLVNEGYNVILSDADALWLGDPMEYINLVNSSSVITSRGSHPHGIGTEWGSTMCMGFAMFRATGIAMNTFQDAMERIVLETGDDQVAVNQAALHLGVAWDEDSDMRYEQSTGFGKGTIANLSGDDGKPFEITLLPHNKFVRLCTHTPLSNDTVVAHCLHAKTANAKTNWMQKLTLWSPDGMTPGPAKRAASP